MLFGYNVISVLFIGLLRTVDMTNIHILGAKDVSINTNLIDKRFNSEFVSDFYKKLSAYSCGSEDASMCYDKTKLMLWKKRKRSYFTKKHIDNHRKRNSLIISTETPRPVGISNASETVNNDNRDFLIAKFKKKWPVLSWEKYGYFSEDYLLLINEHWLQFPPPERATNYALGGLYVLMMFVGCSGNILVIFMYFRCSSLRTPGNVLVANLALSDFLMLAKTPIFIFNSFNSGPALGKIGCVVYGFVGGLTGTTSIATLAAIALDRYWAVVRPLEPLRTLTALRARVFALASWLYAATFSAVPALDIGYGRYVPEGFLTSCSFDYLTEELPARYFIFAFFCAAWVAPLFTITFCYLKILRVVVCNGNMASEHQEQKLSSKHIKKQAKRKSELKLAVLVIAVIALFFVSWTPYAVVALLGIFGRKDLITPLTSMIPALFCKTAACINPFIYIITHPRFRKEIKKMFCRTENKRVATMKSMAPFVMAPQSQRQSRDFSDTEVEIIEIKDLPFTGKSRF